MHVFSRRAFVRTGLAVAITGLLPVLPARAAAIADVNEAINKAGRMRMLSQRMAKLYCQMGLGVLPDKARQLLTASMKLYREHLVELKAYAPHADIRATYEELEQVWREYEKLLNVMPSQANVRQIASINEDALRIAHLATTQLELHAGTSVGRLINISGRQRMLSQRMAKFYMFRQWGITSPEMEKEARLAQREFVSALQALNQAPENNDKIKGVLELAGTQWLFFEQALRQQATGGKTSTDAEHVATTSERILQVMDRITGLYAGLNAKAAPNSRAAIRP